MLERTVREIQGQPCIDLEHVVPAKKENACTRSFRQPTTRLADLVEAVTEFAARAAEKLRKQEGHAGQVLVFIRTLPSGQTSSTRGSITVPLRRPTADTSLIVVAAIGGLRAISEGGFKLAKAGVMHFGFGYPRVASRFWSDRTTTSKHRGFSRAPSFR